MDAMRGAEYALERAAPRSHHVKAGFPALIEAIGGKGGVNTVSPFAQWVVVKRNFVEVGNELVREFCVRQRPVRRDPGRMRCKELLLVVRLDETQHRKFPFPVAECVEAPRGIAENLTIHGGGNASATDQQGIREDLAACSRQVQHCVVGGGEQA